MLRALVALAAAGLTLCACRLPVPYGARFFILKDGRRVQWVRNLPGPVAFASPLEAPSLAAPGFVHPYLEIVNLDQTEAIALAGLWRESKSCAEYLERARDAGYWVEPTETDLGPRPSLP